MNKHLFWLAFAFILILGLLAACGDDDDDSGDDAADDDVADDDDNDDITDDDTAGDDDTGDDDTGDDDTGDDDTGDDDTADDDTVVTDYALFFDGTTGYASTSGNLSPALSNPFTVEGWAYLENAAPGMDQVLVQYYTASGKAAHEVDLYYESYDLTLIFGYININGFFNFVPSLAAAPVNTWFHFAGTYSDNGSSSDFCLYIDGVQQNCASGDILGTVNAHLKLGKLEMNDYGYLDGGLNEVRLSSVVRYASGFTVPTDPFTTDADTIALYHFDEGSGATASDNSTNNNDLTLTGGYTWTAVTD